MTSPSANIEWFIESADTFYKWDADEEAQLWLLSFLQSSVEGWRHIHFLKNKPVLSTVFAVDTNSLLKKQFFSRWNLFYKAKNSNVASASARALPPVWSHPTTRCGGGGTLQGVVPSTLKDLAAAFFLPPSTNVKGATKHRLAWNGAFFSPLILLKAACRGLNILSSQEIERIFFFEQGKVQWGSLESWIKKKKKKDVNMSRI